MILKSQRPLVALIWLCGLFAFSSAISDELAEDDAEALAKKAQNPISTMISLPLQNNTDFDFQDGVVAVALLEQFLGDNEVLF